MLYCFYTNIVSPHQLPFARELVKRVGVENYRYVYSEPFHAERSAMGWKDEPEPWILSQIEQREESRRWLEDADVLILGHRDLDLIERRCQKGLLTFYASERWFKPIPLRVRCLVPGWVRLFVPGYFRMARRFVSLLYRYDSFKLLPYGVWAARDFRLLCRLFHPLPTTHYQLPTNKITTWGYAVAPSVFSQPQPSTSTTDRALHVLWVGRMLNWKRVDTIIRAVALVNKRKVTLTLVGDGPEKPHLQHLASTLQLQLSTTTNLPTTLQLPLPTTTISFLPPCPIHEVRSLMREHDLYVLSSDAGEGWGAALNEALEEGMLCIGSTEAGASATLLPVTHQFPAGDARRLAELLRTAADGKLPRVAIGSWSAAALAERFLTLCEGMKRS